ncbi:hypothetical protein [uncultured Roseobacter sp.]|uniref:hypothetical protein n=1 Tax=uncultured Roseobacter sp. TaxID=114847 RepID=UPI002633B47B|nr:hypothetical protein [uncultured Roseobacter sp.]
MKRITYLGATAPCFAGLIATLGQAATVGTYNTLTGAAPPGDRAQGRPGLTEGKYSDNIDTSRAVIQTLIDKGYDTPEKSVV